MLGLSGVDLLPSLVLVCECYQGRETTVQQHWCILHPFPKVGNIGSLPYPRTSQLER